MRLRLAWQMLRQRTPPRFYFRGRRRSFCRTPRGTLGWLGGLLELQIFQPQLQLFDLPLELLRLAPKLHPPELAEQQFQSFDLAVPLQQLLFPLEQLLLSGNTFLVFGQQQRLQRFSI
jgi:hypothetical protein